MAAYQSFISPRTTEPDAATLLSSLRASVDVTIGVAHTADSGAWIFKKATDWSAQDVVNAQAVLDTCTAQTTQTLAQTRIDQWPIEFRALLLALLDQLNVLRARAGLVAITPAQALQGVRDKAATLS